MARLSKVQTYAILWLHSQKNDNQTIAKDIDISVDQVNKVIEKNFAAGSDAIKTASESATKNKSKSKNLMITETRDKKTKNVSIMTKEASAFNDEVKKNFITKRFNDSTIYRPNK